MSLKAFHIVFIALATLLSLGFAAWEIDRYLATGDLLQLGGAFLAVLAGIALVIYGVRFLRKLRKVSFI